MIYIPNVWPKPCPKRLLLPTWREYALKYIYDYELFFLELHSTTQTLITRTHTHPYEHTYVNPTSMSTSERLGWHISRFTKSLQASVLPSTETSPTTESIAPLNSKINSEKYEYSCQVKNLNLSGLIPPHGTQPSYLWSAVRVYDYKLGRRIKINGLCLILCYMLPLINKSYYQSEKAAWSCWL
jgi:hypothetical protein